ncbi:hypothetical protein JW979_13680 [bacterium]|nr:hypothetical protein [candidate division CSSED10-310 bacterium]
MTHFRVTVTSNGFSLVDVLLAIVFTGIAFMGIFTLFRTYTDAVYRSELQVRRALIAQSLEAYIVRENLQDEIVSPLPVPDDAGIEAEPEFTWTLEMGPDISEGHMMILSIDHPQLNHRSYPVFMNGLDR